MNHQKLICYHRLLEIAKMVPTLLSTFPRGTYYLEDQLKRALSSAMLNLSEGNGRSSIKERNRFFDFSLGSISELLSIVDICAAYGYITSNFEMTLKSNLEIAYKMIFKLKK